MVNQKKRFEDVYKLNKDLFNLSGIDLIYSFYKDDNKSIDIFTKEVINKIKHEFEDDSMIGYDSILKLYSKHNLKNYYNNTIVDYFNNKLNDFTSFENGVSNKIVFLYNNMVYKVSEYDYEIMGEAIA